MVDQLIPSAYIEYETPGSNAVVFVKLITNAEFGCNRWEPKE